jgi:hypothetical protein
VGVMVQRNVVYVGWCNLLHLSSEVIFR